MGNNTYIEIKGGVVLQDKELGRHKWLIDKDEHTTFLSIPEMSEFLELRNRVRRWVENSRVIVSA